MTDHRITLIGAKGSGKSTWLASFYDSLSRGHVRRFSAASTQPTDRSAWEQLARPLRNGRYASRTPDSGSFPQVRVLTTGSWSTRKEYTLEAADYLGEEIERSFSRNDDSWTSSWDRRAQADAFVLVVRPGGLADIPKPPPLAAGELRNIKALFVSRDAAAGASSKEIILPTEVAPSLPERGDTPDQAGSQEVAPTLFTVIEMLQMIRSRRGWETGERPGDVRVAIVLTAWDAVESRYSTLGPECFLRERLGLLDDFVWSNFDPDLVRCFGLSATGGDLGDPTYVEQFHAQTGPIGSVTWTTSGDAIHCDDDVSLPFAWTIAGDAALVQNV